MRQGCVLVSGRAEGGANGAGRVSAGLVPPPYACARMDVPNASDGEVPPDHAEGILRVRELRWGEEGEGGEGRMRAYGTGERGTNVVATAKTTHRAEVKGQGRSR